MQLSRLLSIIRHIYSLFYVQIMQTLGSTSKTCSRQCNWATGRFKWSLVITLPKCCCCKSSKWWCIPTWSFDVITRTRRWWRLCFLIVNVLRWCASWCKGLSFKNFFPYLLLQPLCFVFGYLLNYENHFYRRILTQVSSKDIKVRDYVNSFLAGGR